MGVNIVANVLLHPVKQYLIGVFLAYQPVTNKLVYVVASPAVYHALDY
jgi:hypothetical protein